MHYCFLFFSPLKWVLFFFFFSSDCFNIMLAKFWFCLDTTIILFFIWNGGRYLKFKSIMVKVSWIFAVCLYTAGNHVVFWGVANDVCVQVRHYLVFVIHILHTGASTLVNTCGGLCRICGRHIFWSFQKIWNHKVHINSILSFENVCSILMHTLKITS